MIDRGVGGNVESGFLIVGLADGEVIGWWKIENKDFKGGGSAAYNLFYDVKMVFWGAVGDVSL